MTAWPCPPPPPPELLKQNLAMTWSCVLHVIKFMLFTTQGNHSILEFAHLKFQWFLRPLPPPYVTKHPLILFSPNFASYFHIKTLIKTKFICWTQPLTFVWLQQSWDHYRLAPIFLLELNFANGNFFCVFCRTNFCAWGNCLVFLGINFCDFPEATFYLEL